MSNTILVTGATGYQGGAVVKHLLQKGFLVKGLARSIENTQHLQDAGVEMIQGNFEEVNTLIDAFKGVDKAYISFPLIFDEAKLLQFAQNIVTAWKKSAISLFVFNTNLPVYHQTVGFAAFDAKLAIEQFFDAEQLPYISLRPTLYSDNLSAPFLLPVIKEKGILPYPVPAGARIAWISHQDLGRFVAEAFNHRELIGQKFDIGGIQLITGEELAHVISKYAARPVQFVSIHPDGFEAQLSGTFGSETAREIANIYRFIQENTAHLEAKNLRVNTLIKLPVSLQTFNDWASEVKWN